MRMVVGDELEPGVAGVAEAVELVLRVQFIEPPPVARMHVPAGVCLQNQILFPAAEQDAAGLLRKTGKDVFAH